jgi:glutamine phosphoribosylpyrophosphate amidotransferase
MCGVLGIAIKNFTKKDHDLVRGLFIQSMIRGKHATGVSYVKNGIVNTVKEPIPANEFISKQNLNEWVNEDGSLYCIGHIRYSTSDLRYNQPFATDRLGIVHNGVISQEPRDTWEETYGFETETANDSELILRALEQHKNPLQTFPNASMAVCTIEADKTITAFRNNERPLYCSIDERYSIFTSTKDIAKRSGLTNTKKCSMFNLYKIERMHTLKYIPFEKINAEDLQ